MRLVWKIAALMGWLAGAAAMPAAADTVDLEARVQALLGEFQEEYGFPGATVAYVLPDGTLTDVVIGLADVEADVPMTSESRMLAASIGKTMVAAAVLSLESDGVLNRADHVSQYLGATDWFARVPNATEMTIGHLLTHTAGLPNHVHMDGVVAELMANDGDGHVAPEEAIASILDMPPLFEAGTAWAYTDTGYLLLGLVIEAATERDYYDLVQERFLDPLDLTQSEPSNSPVLAGLAVGYTDEGNPFGLPARTMDEEGVMLWNPAIEWTGGGLISTSHDLARWGHALFSGTALGAPYLDRMLDGVPVNPEAPSIVYGSGVAIYTESEFGPIYGHSGWIPGYVSSLRHYPDYGVTLAFQVNSDVGVLDDSTDLSQALRAALTALILETVQEE